MPKYRVCFTRDVTESCFVDVLAASEEGAIDAAHEAVGHDYSNATFELDEMSCGTTPPYVSDVEEQEEPTNA